MFALKPKAEVVIRVLLSAVILLNALAPTAALAKSSQRSSGVIGENEDFNALKSLPEQKPLYYEPPMDSFPQQTGPEPDEVESPVPDRGQVEFILTAEPAIVPPNGTVTFHVYILAIIPSNLSRD
jgi:hypothetical protein